MSRFRLPIVVCACCLFWAFLGALLGLLFRHALGGLIFGLLFGIAYTVIGGWASEKFPLDVWGAKLLENAWAPNLYEMLHALCATTRMELPTLYSIPRQEPNAFVIAGRDGDTAIVVTNGLTRLLEKDEVQAVAALMMARLATNAMPAWTIASTLAGLPLHLGMTLRGKRGLSWLGTGILTLFVYPAAGLLRLAWSQSVVIAADYHAAHLAERPGALESALVKIEAAWAGAGDQAMAGNPATALLFAVAPRLTPSAGDPLWQRTLSAFPARQPDAAARALRFLGPPTPTQTE